MMNTSPLRVGLDPTGISLLINETVVTQHADDAAFLWTVRDRAVNAPHFRLKDLVRWDERVEAHLDGLRVSGDFGWCLCENMLAENPGRAFACGVLAFGSQDSTRVSVVLDGGTAEPELSRALVSALGWLDFDVVARLAADLARSGSPEIRCMALAAFAIHRRDPGRELGRALSDPDPRLRRRAVVAAGQLGAVDHLPALLAILSDPSDDLRLEAARAAALLGDRAASLSVLESSAFTDTPGADRALDLLLRVVPLERAIGVYHTIRDRTGQSRRAAQAAGVIAVPELVPDLLELMSQSAASRAAGEALSAITGVDLEFSDLDGTPVEVEPEEEMPEVDDDDDLPWPSTARVSEWWKSHRSRFTTGARSVLGQPLGRDSLLHALSVGTQRQRASAAIELALRKPARPVFETRARGRRQIGMLESWTS